MTPLVIIESPYSGDVVRNTAYARACLLDSLRRGEAPFASHLLYTQVLDDTNPKERTLGLYTGFEWHAAADVIAVYDDFGVSGGMAIGLSHWKSVHGEEGIEYRSLGGDWAKLSRCISETFSRYFEARLGIVRPPHSHEGTLPDGIVVVGTDVDGSPKLWALANMRGNQVCCTRHDYQYFHTVEEAQEALRRLR